MISDYEDNYSCLIRQYPDLQSGLVRQYHDPQVWKFASLHELAKVQPQTLFL
jgi:hypothetical protein